MSSFTCTKPIHALPYGHEPCADCTVAFLERYEGPGTIDNWRADSLASITRVAISLEISRATVNRWVLGGKLQGERYGAEWWIRRGDLKVFLQTWTRPKGRRPGQGFMEQGNDDSTLQILLTLENWHSADAGELAQRVDLHRGNIGKRLKMMENVGLVEQQADGQWLLTERGKRAAGQVDPDKRAAIYDQLRLEPIH